MNLEEAKEIVSKHREEEKQKVLAEIEKIIADKEAFIAECDEKIQKALGDNYVLVNTTQIISRPL